MSEDEAYDKFFISDFLDWILENCEIIEAGDPFTGDLWKKWFYYKGEQMYGMFHLLNIYIKYLKDNETTQP